jgi:hypothetical protein
MIARGRVTIPITADRISSKTIKTILPDAVAAEGKDKVVESVDEMAVVAVRGAAVAVRVVDAVKNR